jgi:hypothetical protein
MLGRSSHIGNEIPTMELALTELTAVLFAANWNSSRDVWRFGRSSAFHESTTLRAKQDGIVEPMGQVASATPPRR